MCINSKILKAGKGPWSLVCYLPPNAYRSGGPENSWNILRASSFLMRFLEIDPEVKLFGGAQAQTRGFALARDAL